VDALAYKEKQRRKEKKEKERKGKRERALCVHAMGASLGWSYFDLQYMVSACTSYSSNRSSFWSYVVVLGIMSYIQSFVKIKLQNPIIELLSYEIS